MILAIALGVITTILMFENRSEAGSAFLWGVSLARFGLAAALIGISLVLAAFLMGSFVWRGRFEAGADRLKTWIRRPKVWGWWFVLSACGALIGAYFILLAAEVDEPYFQALSSRLAPLVIWFSGWCLLNLFLLAFIQADSRTGDKGRVWGVVLTFLALTGLFFLPWMWVVGNFEIYEAKLVGWNELGVPIIETQLFLAWSIAIACVGIFSIRLGGKGARAIGERLRPHAIDWLLAGLIWLSAVVLWNRTPISPSWFVSEARPPNQAIYPSSDALLNDLSAQVILAGQGYHYITPLLSQRPLYTLFLFLVHAVAGQDYGSVVFVQILALAFIPVLIYLVTSRLFNRFAGLLAGLLILFREMNSIALSETVTASHAKALMVDLPVTLVVLLLTWLLMRWIKTGGEKNLYPLLAGGAFGALLLLRLELVLLMGGIVILVVISARKDWRPLLVSFSLFLVGIVLVYSPWTVRNLAMAENGPLDFIKYNLGFVAWRANMNQGVNTDDTTRQEFQEDAEIVPTMRPAYPRIPAWVVDTPTAENRMPTPLAPVSSAITPEEVASPADRPALSRKLLTMAAHYINSQTQVVLILPGIVRSLDSMVAFTGHKSGERLSEECCSLVNYVRRLPYWHKWDGNFPRQAIIPILLNLFMVALGIRAAGRRGLEGLTPLVIGLTFLSANALIQNSGGRYILPADWFGVVYFSVGLAQASIVAGSLLSGRASTNVLLVASALNAGSDVRRMQNERRVSLSWRNPWLYGCLAGLAVLGLALPLIEISLPPRYPDEMKQEMIATLMASDVLDDRERQFLERELSKDDLQIMVGNAYYPNFFPAKHDDLSRGNVMQPRTYAWIGFYLVGQQSLPIIIPSPNKPAYLPNDGLVLVFSDASRSTNAVAVFRSPLEAVDVIIPEK